MTAARIPCFGDIGLTVTAASVRERLAMLDPSMPVVVELSSEGGSVQAAIEILNELRKWPGGVDVEVTGWALSAATIIAMAGRTIRVYPEALLMVHAPWMSTAGNSDALRQQAAVLDQVAETMRSAYRRTGQSAAVIDGWLDGRDHWFTAEEAKAVGLVDEILTAMPTAAARVAINVNACRHTIPATIRQRFNAMPQPNTQPSQDDARAEGIRAEAQRQAEIRATFGRSSLPNGAIDLMNRCLSDINVDVATAKLRLLDLYAVGVTPVAGHYTVKDPVSIRTGDRMGEFIAAATDVLLARGGVPVAEPHPAAGDIRGMGVVAMAESIISMRGGDLADRTRGAVINAALSTSDFPALLANVAGKALRLGYESAPATFIGWTGEREVADFKPQSLVLLSEAPGLLEVKEGAEYTRGKFDDSAAPFQVKTFGRIVEITRQALINDDVNAFTRMPQSFGLAARRLEADLVYSMLTSNPTLSDGVALFHANHGNLGAAAGIAVDSLGLARAAMRKQKGLQGQGYIDPQPAYLIVPVALETEAEQLLSSLVDPSKNNATPTNEWIVRGLTLVADPRLDEVSETQWYLSAAPSNVEGIVRAYIQGEQRPYFEENGEFSRDVLAFKTRLDVSSAVVDHRALYRAG